jgi:hypothetical protein
MTMEDEQKIGEAVWALSTLVIKQMGSKLVKG